MILETRFHACPWLRSIGVFVPSLKIAVCTTYQHAGLRFLFGPSLRASGGSTVGQSRPLTINQVYPACWAIAYYHSYQVFDQL